MKYPDFIQKLAKNLPQKGYAVKDQALVSGEDLLLANTEEVKGEKVVPEKEYLMTLPRFHEYNHKRRLQRAYKKGGTDEVVKYTRPFILDEHWPAVESVIRQRL